MGRRHNFLRGTQRDIRTEFQDLIDQGYKVERTGGGHIAVYHPNGRDIMHTSGTPDRPERAVKRIRTWVRRCHELDNQRRGA